MASYLSKDQLQIMFNFGCVTLKSETLSELMELGADPLWQDHNGIPIINRALSNQAGKNASSFSLYLV